MANLLFTCNKSDFLVSVPILNILRHLLNSNTLTKALIYSFDWDAANLYFLQGRVTTGAGSKKMRKHLFIIALLLFLKKHIRNLLGDHYSIRIPSPRLHIQMIRKIPIAVEKNIKWWLQICLQIYVW